MRFCNLAHEKLSSNHYIFFSSQWSFFLPISNLQLKPFSMQKSMVFYWWGTPSWVILVWVNYNCYWLKGAYDRFYTQNVSNVCEFTEADDSLSREPIIITPRLTWEWFSLVPSKKIRLIFSDKPSHDWLSQREQPIRLLIKKDNTYLKW